MNFWSDGATCDSCPHDLSSVPRLSKDRPLSPRWSEMYHTRTSTKYSPTDTCSARPSATASPIAWITGTPWCGAPWDTQGWQLRRQPSRRHTNSSRGAHALRPGRITLQGENTTLPCRHHSKPIPCSANCETGVLYSNLDSWMKQGLRKTGECRSPSTTHRCLCSTTTGCQYRTGWCGYRNGMPTRMNLTNGDTTHSHRTASLCSTSSSWTSSRPCWSTWTHSPACGGMTTAKYTCCTALSWESSQC